MLNRIIEITGENKEISCNRGFICIKEKGNVLGEIPFDSVLSIIISASSAIYTHAFLQRLSEYEIPLLVCGKNYMPLGIYTPLVGQHRQSAVQKIQFSVSEPLRKNLWRSLVKEKIKNQGRLLEKLKNSQILSDMEKHVLSGDKTLVEAQAARKYFPELFGKTFIRNHEQNGINAFLNYGYAVFRACLSRYVVAAGLNPHFGLNHKNQLNPFCLVDDLIEPFRPLMDNLVFNLFNGVDDKNRELFPSDKKEITSVLYSDYSTSLGISPLYMIMQNLVWDLVKSYKNKKDCLSFDFVLIAKNDASFES